MKNLFAALLCISLLALCACGQAEPEQTSAPPTTTATTTQAPTTTEAPLTLSSYKDAPVAYKPILDALYLSLQQAQVNWDEGEEIFALETEYVMEPWFVKRGDLGYAVKDVNKDGVPELLLLSQVNRFWGTQEGISILTIFTLKGNEPVQLAQYYRREWGRLAADGTLYVVGYGGTCTGLYSYILDANASELTLLTEYHRLNGDFYKGAYDEWQPITEDEFNALHEQYSDPPNPMPLNFIPIEQ